MKREHINLALLFIIPVYFVSRLIFSEINIYVSPDGDDSNSGSRFSKVATAEKALELVAELRNDGKNRAVIVEFEEGRYELSTTLEIDAKLSPKGSGSLKLKAAKGKEVRFSGGRLIDPTSIIPGKDGLVKIDLKKEGIDPVSPRAVGFGRPYGESWTELFINNQPYRLARWPDSSSVPIGKILDKGSVPRDGDYSGRGASFRYYTPRPASWSGPNNIWISGYFMHGYADDAVRLLSIDTLDKIFNTAQPTLYGFGSGKPWQSWYAYNIKEEISLPDEYYLDPEGLIIFRERDDISLLEVSVLGEPMLAIEDISNVMIEDIIFESSRGMGVYMENTIGCSLSRCTFRNLGSLAVSIGKGIESFEELKHDGDGIPGSRTLGSILQYSYSNTLFNREGGYNNGLMDCHIYNTGGGGVHLGGGDRKTLEAAGNYVVNTTIHDFNRIEKSYRAGIDISGVGNKISNCEIYNAPSMAILLHGNDHVIAFNDIHNVCTEVNDQGALYYGRDPSERGLSIFYNYFHDIPDMHSTSSVYHDDGACGAEVFGNVFYRAGSIPVLIGGGSDISYSNNIFVDCKLGIHVDDRFRGWSKNSLEEGEIIDTRLKAVNHTMPPYSEKYPELVSYWDEDPSLPKRNIISNNLFVNIERLYRWNNDWLEIGDNYSSQKDPGFIEYGVDFTLKDESPVFSELPEFGNIPFDKIGPQKLRKAR